MEDETAEKESSWTGAVISCLGRRPRVGAGNLLVYSFRFGGGPGRRSLALSRGSARELRTGHVHNRPAHLILGDRNVPDGAAHPFEQDEPVRIVALTTLLVP